MGIDPGQDGAGENARPPGAVRAGKPLRSRPASYLPGSIGAGITTRRIGSPGGASSGGTTRSFGIAIGSVRGVDELVVGREHQDRLDALAVVGGLVVANVAFGKREILGHGEPDQRRARAGRRKRAEAARDAGLVQAVDHLCHRRSLALVHVVGNVGRQIAVRIAHPRHIRGGRRSDPGCRGQGGRDAARCGARRRGVRRARRARDPAGRGGGGRRTACAARRAARVGNGRREFQRETPAARMPSATTR